MTKLPASSAMRRAYCWSAPRIFAACVFFAAAAPAEAPARIACPGAYKGHIQGLATDAAYNIYWAFTTTLVKTDEHGKLLASVEVPTHHGSPTVVKDRLYVAVNLGKFNREAGEADSWVYGYATEGLQLLEKHAVPEAMHGAGGIAWHDGVFTVVGGLPPGHDRNYAYRYDENFKFIERKEVLSGNTLMGIQTACFHGGAYWLGVYGAKGGLLKAGPSLEFLARYELDGSYGIAPWRDGQWLRGESIKDGALKRAAAVIEAPPSR